MRDEENLMIEFNNIKEKESNDIVSHLKVTFVSVVKCRAIVYFYCDTNC